MNAQASAKKKAAPAPAPAWVADIGLVRPAALMFAAALAGAVAVVGISHWFSANEQASTLQARQDRDNAARQIADVETQKLDLQRYRDRFAQLQALGLTGEERRLDWVVAIKQIQQARKLLGISYEIEPQQVFRLDGAVDTGDYQLRGSKMTLHMDLLHEMDLLTFLDDLKRRGFFTVQHCAVKRGGMTADTSQGQGPGLIADCTLVWLSLAKGAPALPAAMPAGPQPAQRMGQP